MHSMTAQAVARPRSALSLPLFRDYLEIHRGEIDVADLELAAFILVTTVEALTHSAVLRRPDILADEKAGEFVDEMTGLVLRYLRTPSSLRRGRGAAFAWEEWLGSE
jgi:hypothetical protein